MGFTKLDERIIQSSIMVESPETFKVWITLLAMCKEDGIAECSPVFLEAVCRIPIAKIIEAVDVLSAPDKLSRSIDNDGRRIERVDGGYKIINYEKYRTESLRSAEAERKRLYRQNHKCPDTSGRCPDSSASVSASVSHKGDARGKYVDAESFGLFWTAYPRKVGKANAWRAWIKFSPDIKIVLDALAWQTKQEQWTRDNGQYIPHPATYINGHRWDDRPIVVAAMEKPKFEFNKL